MTTDDLGSHDTACPCLPCQRDPYVDPAGPAVPAPGPGQARTADAVLEYARELGLQLEPWQVDMVRALYAGHLVHRSRRGGLTTVRQLIADYHVLTSRPSPWSSPSA